MTKIKTKQRKCCEDKTSRFCPECGNSLTGELSLFCLLDHINEQRDQALRNLRGLEKSIEKDVTGKDLSRRTENCLKRRRELFAKWDSWASELSQLLGIDNA